MPRLYSLNLLIEQVRSFGEREMDPIEVSKKMQKEGWVHFAPLEMVTMRTAIRLGERMTVPSSDRGVGPYSVEVLPTLANGVLSARSLAKAMRQTMTIVCTLLSTHVDFLSALTPTRLGTIIELETVRAAISRSSLASSGSWMRWMP